MFLKAAFMSQTLCPEGKRCAVVLKKDQPDLGAAQGEQRAVRAWGCPRAVPPPARPQARPGLGCVGQRAAVKNEWASECTETDVGLCPQRGQLGASVGPRAARMVPALAAQAMCCLAWVLRVSRQASLQPASRPGRLRPLERKAWVGRGKEEGLQPRQ